jgi:membrane protease YdiL (CAAX protease family)
MNIQPAGYRSESARPLTSLLFITPMLVAYEAGIFVFGDVALRNGADAWLRGFLKQLGFGQYFLLPVLAAAILLAWHHTSRVRWKVNSRVVAGMWVESLVLGITLLFSARLLALVFFWTKTPFQASLFIGDLHLPTICGYFGAGIYEELLFRLMLLPAILGLLTWCGCGRRTATVWAVIGSSLLFSLAHYDLFSRVGDEFNPYSFVFRTLAGIFFAIIFLKRGFGIAAGTHAMYDICTLAW